MLTHLNIFNNLEKRVQLLLPLLCSFPNEIEVHSFFDLSLGLKRYTILFSLIYDAKYEPYFISYAEITNSIYTCIFLNSIEFFDYLAYKI